MKKFKDKHGQTRLEMETIVARHISNLIEPKTAREAIIKMSRLDDDAVVRCHMFMIQSIHKTFQLIGDITDTYNDNKIKGDK